MFIKKQRMIELQNINLRLRAGGNVKKRNWYLILGMLLLVQLIAIFYFGSKKAGFHYDEYYSYYSSNVSIGLVPTDREWKPGSEIVDEFRVLPGQRFQYGTVTRMQTYDVHPPFYYLLLHTVCSLFPGRLVQQMVRNWTEYSAFRSELECAGEADAADCDGCAEERGCAWWESADLCNGGGRSGAYYASDDFRSVPPVWF